MLRVRILLGPPSKQKLRACVLRSGLFYSADSVAPNCPKPTRGVMRRPRLSMASRRGLEEHRQHGAGAAESAVRRAGSVARVNERWPRPRDSNPHGVFPTRSCGARVCLFRQAAVWQKCAPPSSRRMVTRHAKGPRRNGEGLRLPICSVWRSSICYEDRASSFMRFSRASISSRV